MKRSRKQANRERLTYAQVRDREARKRTDAERALWVTLGGQVAWQQEMDRQRRARNERVRGHTRQVLAQRKLAARNQSHLLWQDSAA